MTSAAYISTFTRPPQRKPVSSLGLVPDGARSVKPVPKDLLGLVPKPKNISVEIKDTGTDPERDTVPLMKKKIRRTVYQVEKLAPRLKGSSVMDTVRNDWNFVFDHIQYVEDPKNIEAVRDPARTIHDGKGDCDCFTVCLGALLQAQRIPYKIRVAAYENPKEWGHVYIVVPDGKKEIIVDPVLHKFNHEASYVDKKDFDMKLVSLEGVPTPAAAAADCKSSGDQTKKLRRYVDTQQVVQWGFIPTQQFLEENKIAYHQQPATDDASSKFVITSPDGEMSVPTIITHDMALKIKQLFADAQGKAKDAAGQLQQKFKWWWLVAGGLALYVLCSGDKKNEKKAEKTNATPSLDGPKKKSKKRQAKKLAKLQL